MNKADGNKKPLAFRFGNSRGTNEAGAVSVFLLGFRNPDLSLKTSWTNLGLNDDLHEDAPAWWLLKKKKSMYSTGGADARSVRSVMQFMMSPLHGPDHFNTNEKKFADLQAFMLSIQPPAYPFNIDQSLASLGKEVFKTIAQNVMALMAKNPTIPTGLFHLMLLVQIPKDFLVSPKNLGDSTTHHGFQRKLKVGFQMITKHAKPMAIRPLPWMVFGLPPLICIMVLFRQFIPC